MNTCTTCRYFSNSSCHRYPPKVVSYTESERKGSDGEYHDEIEICEDASYGATAEFYSRDLEYCEYICDVVPEDDEDWIDKRSCMKYTSLRDFLGED